MFELQPMPPLSQDTHYAGFWVRFGAFFIDALLIFACCCMASSLSNVIFSFFPLVLQSELIANGLAFLVSAFSLVGPWLYFALQEASSAQATVGKRVWSLKVCQQDGEKLSFGRASWRYWSKQIHMNGLAVCGVLVFCIIQSRIASDLWKGLWGTSISYEHYSPGGAFGPSDWLFSVTGVIVSFCLGYVAGCVMAAFTPKKQALHDLMAKTVVTKAVEKTSVPTDASN